MFSDIFLAALMGLIGYVTWETYVCQLTDVDRMELDDLIERIGEEK